VVKFCGVDTERQRPVLGIGLSRENCDRLLEGQPILFDTANMTGFPDLTVCIIAGENELSIAASVLEAGCIREEQILEDKSLGDPHVPKGKVN
jgi:hypothetical protein